MSTLSEILQRAATHPEALTAEDFATLRSINAQAPASTIAAALLLRYDTSLSESTRGELQQRVALLQGDRRATINFIDPTGSGFDNFYPPMQEPERPSTISAIDTFLSTYGHQSPEEDALLERMIFNPVPDYAEQLARTEPKPGEAQAGSQDALIDAFLAENPVPSSKPLAPQEPPQRPPMPTHSSSKAKPAENTLLSESLAKIFIKQGRYERAYDIISNLSLNYPKKSAYFADQLRFLRKLIINAKYSPAQNASK